jgi:hypothetical protein
VLAGVGLVAAARLASGARGRAALAAVLVVVSVPFAVSRAIGLGHQAGDARGRAAELSDLWRAVDRAQRRVPVARLHPVVEPGALANALAWKLHLRLRGVVGAFSPAAVRIAFIEGDERPVIARLRRRGATAVRLAAAGSWHVLLVRWKRSRVPDGPAHRVSSAATTTLPATSRKCSERLLSSVRSAQTSTS